MLVNNVEHLAAREPDIFPYNLVNMKSEPKGEWMLECCICWKFTSWILNTVSVLCLQLVSADLCWSKHYFIGIRKKLGVSLLHCCAITVSQLFPCSVGHIVWPDKCHKQQNGNSVGKKLHLKEKKNNLWEAISHEMNTTIMYHDIIICAQLLFEYKNLGSSGMDHWQISW